MELVTALGLIGVGTLMTELAREEKKINDYHTPEISPNEEPSSTNIFNSRYLEAVRKDEEAKAKNLYNTTAKNNLLYRNWPEMSWQERIYSKDPKVTELERQLNNPHPWESSTTLPMSTLTEIANTSAANDFKSKDNFAITQKNGINKMRHRMPPSSYKVIGKDSAGNPIYKTTYDNGKSIKFYEKGHNNMEPFIGKKGVNQNMNPVANQQRLETFTGENPYFRQKRETKRFFPLVKDPFAVGGLPSTSNREVSRYIPSITHQNSLPFTQVREAPGLNKDHLQSTSNIGFHDPYRPIGKGMFQDIDKTRVNPKSIYKGKMSGEQYFVPYGTTKTAPVISRKHKNLMFSNFHDKKEGFSNHFDKYPYQNYVRRMIPQQAEVQRGKPNVCDTVVLKETSRTTTGSKLCKYPPHSYSSTRGQTYSFDNARHTLKQEMVTKNEHNSINPNDENRRNQTYFFDTAKDTIKQQTAENDDHSKINPTPTTERGQTYFLDAAKGTIKQQTVDNDNHSKINLSDETRRNQTYFFDTAKETIREQTEDHKNSAINPNDSNRRNQTYFFDTAKETIREQTEVNEHQKVNPSATSRFRLQDISGFLNASINALREAAIAKNRVPTTVGVKMPPTQKSIGKYDIFHRQQFENYDFTKSVNPSVEASRNISQEQIGLPTQFYPEYKKEEETLRSRTDPYLVKEFKSNPYTQSLSSWHIPYNPSFPNKKITLKRELNPPEYTPLECDG